MVTAGKESPPLSPSGSNENLSVERRWASNGELLASAKLSEEAIKAKEYKLRDLITQNYSRIKDVERELAGLQLQLKLTSGPKKSALEMLRKKIETQNDKVLLARRNHEHSQKVADAALEVLQTEERVKDQLCQELNLLIQESAHAQLDKLEQLTTKLETLNRDLTTTGQDLVNGPRQVSALASSMAAAAGGADGSRSSSSVAVKLLEETGLVDPRAALAAAGAAAAVAAGEQKQQQRQGGGSSTNPFEDGAQASTSAGDAAAAAESAADKADAAFKAKAQQAAAAARAAAQAARSRHVQLPGMGGRASSAASDHQQQQQPRRAAAQPAESNSSSSGGGDGVFRGFDA